MPPSTPGRALHEYDRLVRTVGRRRRTPAALRRHLAKGESLHALRRDMLVAHGAKCAAASAAGPARRSASTLVTNAGVPWTTAYR